MADDKKDEKPKDEEKPPREPLPPDRKNDKDYSDPARRQKQ
jgi:hypothetical protein